MNDYTPLPETREAWALPSAGRRLEAIREAGKRLRDRILSSGRAEAMVTRDVFTVAYPTRFAMQSAALTPWPYLLMTNRMNVVQFTALDGSRKTLLVNPSDYERGDATPFYAKLVDKYGEFVSRKLLSKPFGTPDQQLKSLGLSPEDVDFITYDHLHIQDVRRWLGTTAPSKDGHPEIPAVFPNAKLLVERREWEAARSLHAMQRLWYVPHGTADVPEDRVVVFDGDILLGQGVALVSTTGHTEGNHTIAVNTARGICTISENGVGLDNYVPELSDIPGLAKHAKFWEQEVVLNANTLERTCDQYTSMVLEKILADRCAEATEYPMHLSSSEFRAHPLFPGLAPTFQMRVPDFGTLLKPKRAA